MALPKKKSGGLPKLSNEDLNSIDDVITPISSDELIEEPEIEEEQEYYEKPPIPPKQMVSYPEDLEPDVEEVVLDRIDHKKKKIIPTGGKKAKIKDKDLDNRKNKLLFLKILRLFIILVILVILGLGIKNTWFPKQIYTNEEIAGIAQSAIGRTGFPLEKGRAFAQEFLFNYLNSDSTAGGRQLISKFYTGKADGNYQVQGKIQPNSDNLNGEPLQQKPMLTPILFDEVSVTDYSAIYKFSVYMSNTDGSTRDDKGQLTGHWLSFSVGVYYDKDKDGISIIGDPDLIPTYRIRKPDQLPAPQPLGNGEADNKALSILEPTIDGFIQAYSESSLENHSMIDQYIPSEKPIELISGFGGQVKLLRGKTSIMKQVYKSKEPDEWKIDITVDWVNTQVTPKDSGVGFKSHYVMTIKKTSSDVYLVTKFAPYVYLKGAEK